MMIYIGELLGTFLFTFFNLSIITNVVSKSKNDAIRLFIISIGTSISYILPLILFSDITGGHFNPAITIACFFIDDFNNAFINGYIISQSIGAFIATVLCRILYINVEKDNSDLSSLDSIDDDFNDINNTLDEKRKLYVVVPNGYIFINFVKEFFASFIFMLGIIFITFENDNSNVYINTIYYFLIAFIVGMVFDYTCVSINPFRDIFNRIIFTPLKLRSIMHYVYIVVVILGPILGMISATFFYKFYNIYKIAIFN